MIGKDTILVVLYKRPGYTREILESLAAQPEIKDYHVHFQIDDCIKEVVDLAVAFNATSKTINITYPRVACTSNVYMGLSNAFGLSEFVIMVEDDCLPSHDFLKFMKWAKPLLTDDIRTISAYHKFEDCPEDLYSTVRLAPRWNCWGWATDRRHWENAKQLWDWEIYKSWDSMIAFNYFNNGMHIMPYLSRNKNIGALEGTHVASVEQHTAEVLIHKWADSVPKEQIGDFVWQPYVPKHELEIWTDHPMINKLIIKED